MAIIAKSSGSIQERKLVPSGSHVARCYSMIEIGTVEQEYMGEKKLIHKVIIDFELPLETAVFRDGEEEKPFVISKDYTLSFNEKSTLRKDLEAWRGKAFTEKEAQEFDITKLVGASCMVNVIHQSSKDGSKVYPKIANISPLPKGLECPAQFNPKRILEFDNWNQEVFMSLPQWLCDRISSSKEYQLKFNMNDVKVDKITVDNTEDDGLPF